MPLDTDASSDREQGDPAAVSQPPGGVAEVLGALPVMARVAWFSLGALAATTITLLALLRPWSRSGAGERAVPFEGFPFADNAGVCQEYVALATLRTSHDDAQAIIRRLGSSLPAGLRADNLRIVRAFAPGELWSVAVDAQPGSGTMERAALLATQMNAVPGTGLRFEPVFYSSRRLYDTARVLCMPRTTVTAP